MVVFCAKIVKRLDNRNYVMDQRDFARFEFKINFGLSYIVQLNESHECAFYEICCRYIKNDKRFFVWSEAIRQWFSRVTKSRAKVIAESPHEWQKVVIHGNKCIILFLKRYLCPEHTIPPNPITDFAIVTKNGLCWPSIVTSPQLICDVTRTWDTGIVTSCSSIVLARANWRKGDLR